MKRTIVFLTFISFAVLTFTSCYVDNRRIKGQGPVVEQTFDLPDISALSLSIDANVFVIKGDTQMVTIMAQQNIISNIRKYVSSNGLWRIDFYDEVKSHAGIDIYITTPHFNYATVSGSGRIESFDPFSDSTDVQIKISGSGSVIMYQVAEKVTSEISGSGHITLYGSAQEHDIFISGSGKISAFDLATQSTSIKISGSGNCEVSVAAYLDVVISGSGNVYYKGNPQISTQISGSGNLFKVNN